jgi:hypothetical protein
MTRATEERIDELVRWHGFDGCDRLISEGSPENHDRQLCELALEVLALREELAQFKAAFIVEASKRLPSLEDVNRINDLMRRATEEMVALRDACRRQQLLHPEMYTDEPDEPEAH